MRILRLSVAVVFALAGALGISFLSRVPIVMASPEDGLIRLSWRLRGTHIERCRPRTPEELETLAPHMRTPDVCDGVNAAYELVVRMDGPEILRDTIRPAGVRADRPVYVFQDIETAPGEHRLEVDFRALLPEGFDAGDTPTGLDFAGDIVVGPAAIALVTLDDAGTRLEVRVR